MPDRCAYCGREEGATACPVCLALVEFCEDIGDNEVLAYRAAVCKVHLPWNIIEGIKKNVKEEDDE